MKKHKLLQISEEELNLHFGIHLWGKETGRKSLQQLGATMHLGLNSGDFFEETAESKAR